MSEQDSSVLEEECDHANAEQRGEEHCWTCECVYFYCPDCGEEVDG